MTNPLEPQNEQYPVKPEFERVFTSDEVFAGVQALEGHEIFGDFTFVVGRRGSKNAKKGFSTGEGKTYCPGVECAEELLAEDIVRYATQSLLTNTRHALHPSMGDVSNGKSEDYKERQRELVRGLLKIEPSLHREEEDERELIDLAEKYEKFMTVNGTPADTESVGVAFFATLNLIGKIRAQFSADETSSL